MTRLSRQRRDVTGNASLPWARARARRVEEQRRPTFLPAGNSTFLPAGNCAQDVAAFVGSVRLAESRCPLPRAVRTRIGSVRALGCRPVKAQLGLAVTPS